MKKTTKKLLTLALSTLFVGAGVGTVVAVNNVYDNSGITASADATVHTLGTGGDYADAVALFTAINDGSFAPQAGDTLKLVSDFAIPEATTDGGRIFYVGGLTLDLNGYTLSVPFKACRFVGDSFTVKNGTVDGLGASYGLWIGSGSEQATNATFENLTVKGGVHIFNSSNITLKDMDVNADVEKEGNDYYAVWCDLDVSNVSIIGGKYASVENRATFNCADTYAEVPYTAEGATVINASKTTVDLASAIQVNGRFGFGDFEGNMAHIRLNAQADTVWTEANVAVNNAHLPATVLDNVLVNGKSISQHNAEYKALIESGAESPITWDTSKGSFSGEIADDVNNGRAVYAPIFIKLVNHGTGLAGNTIDIYVPNSYLSAADITEVRITKDFLYETDDYNFCFSDDVIFKSNSVGLLGKYVGEASVPSYNYNVVKTSVQKIDGTSNSTDSFDSFLRFYLDESDYDGLNTKDIADKSILKKINFYDYILVDGVKIGALYNYNGLYGNPGELFFNVWSSSANTLSLRWPNPLSSFETSAAVQEIKILKGCQFPSYVDPTGTVYEVKEDTAFTRMADGVFVSNEYIINNDNITISEATVTGEAGELYAFDITFDGWNSTCNKEDYNYFGSHYVAMRQNILINGVSLYDINANVDDSSYVYSTDPWTSTELDPNGSGKQVHQNPTHITGEGNKLTVYLHKDYVASLVAAGANKIDVTINKGFSNYATPVYVAGEDITKTVYVKDVDITVVVYRNMMAGIYEAYTTTAKYGSTFDVATLVTPEKDGMTFAGWLNVEGEEVTTFTVEEATAVMASWTVNEYKLTIKQDGEEDKVIILGAVVEGNIMAPMSTLADILAAELPAEDANYVYSYAEEIPTEVEYKDYTFTVVATPKIVNATIAGEETTIEIPAGWTAQSYPRMAGDYTFSWTGDATVKVDGTEVANGDVVTLWNSFVQIIPTDSTAACTVVLTLTEYVEPALELAEGSVSVPVTDTWNGTRVQISTAGTWVISAAEGETNAMLLLVSDYSSEMLDLPYTVTVAEGETAYFVVVTANYEEDTIDLVIEKDVSLPAEGSTLTIEEVLALDLTNYAGQKYYVEGEVAYYTDAYKGALYIKDADGNKLCIYGMQKTYSEDYVDPFKYFSYEDKPWVGDTVKFYGAVGTYRDANQLVDAEVEIITKVATDPEASLPEDGSTLTIEEVLALELSSDTLRQYYVTGIVKEILNTTYGNMLIEDQDGNTLKIYGLYDMFTDARFDSMESKPVVGDQVQVKSIISYYEGTVELENARLCDFGPAPVALNLNGETTITIPAGNAETYEGVTITGVAYPDLTTYTGKYIITWDESITNLQVAWGMIGNGGIIDASYSPYEPVEVTFSTMDYSALTVTVTIKPYVEPVTEFAAGNVSVDVKDWNGAKAQISKPGTYTIAAAEGEENAVLCLVTENTSETLELPYTITVAEGETVSFMVLTANWNADVIDFVVTVEGGEVVATTIPEVLEAEDGTNLVVSGTVCEVNGAWSEQYNNMNVTIVDEDGNKLYVYRLSTKVALGDIITVTGVKGSFNGSAQVAQGATAVIDGHDNSYDYVEMTIANALNAEDGVNVIVTGTVVEIETAYSESYGNISVYIADENGTRLYLYRLSGNVTVGKVITVKGTMATYKDARQVTGGTFEVVGDHECSKFTDATCENPATCVVCGEAKDDVLAEHTYVDGVCSVCGAEKPADPVDPDKPVDPEDPADPEIPADPEEPADEEDPSILDKVKDTVSGIVPDQVKAMIPGCSGVVGGIAGGVAALGIAVVALLKKKEDKDE